jgi:hypothetical protein
VNLEVKTSGDGVLPQLNECSFSVETIKHIEGELTIGSVSTFDSSQAGSSEYGNSNPSDSIPKPVGSACEGAIHT